MAVRPYVVRSKEEAARAGLLDDNGKMALWKPPPDHAWDHFRCELEDGTATLGLWQHDYLPNNQSCEAPPSSPRAYPPPACLGRQQACLTLLSFMSPDLLSVTTASPFLDGDGPKLHEFPAGWTINPRYLNLNLKEGRRHLASWKNLHPEPIDDPSRPLRVWVLMGGESSERQVGGCPPSPPLPYLAASPSHPASIASL